MNLLNSFTSLLVGKASSDIRSFGEVPMEQLITMPNYSYTFKFEKEFAHKEIKLWFDRHWTMSFYYVGIYLLMIFLGRLWMAKRPRLELRGPLICWNVMLALFSLFGTLRTVPELVHVVRHHGLYHSICVPR